MGFLPRSLVLARFWISNKPILEWLVWRSRRYYSLEQYSPQIIYLIVWYYFWLLLACHVLNASVMAIVELAWWSTVFPWDWIGNADKVDCFHNYYDLVAAVSSYRFGCLLIITCDTGILLDKVIETDIEVISESFSRWYGVWNFYRAWWRRLITDWNTKVLKENESKPWWPSI